jgi:hypothetical protein
VGIGAVKNWVANGGNSTQMKNPRNRVCMISMLSMRMNRCLFGL